MFWVPVFTIVLIIYMLGLYLGAIRGIKFRRISRFQDNVPYILIEVRQGEKQLQLIFSCRAPAVASSVIFISFLGNLSMYPDPMTIAILLVYVIVISNRSIDLAVTRADLNTAAKIQTAMLPRRFPAFPDRTEFDLFASMTPAREVGGDFYDFFLTDEDHLALVIADVSGKGIPAAMFMMSAKSLIRAQMLAVQDPAAALKNVNMHLYVCFPFLLIKKTFHCPAEFFRQLGLRRMTAPLDQI